MASGGYEAVVMAFVLDRLRPYATPDFLHQMDLDVDFHGVWPENATVLPMILDTAAAVNGMRNPSEL